MANAQVEDARPSPSLVSLGNIVLNRDNYRVTVAGELVDLTYHENELLQILIDNADHVVSYESLARWIWGDAEHLTRRHLNVLIHRIRSKIIRSRPYGIETVRGRGYGLLVSPFARNEAAWAES